MSPVPRALMAARSPTWSVNEHGLDNATDHSEMATLTPPDGYVIVKAGGGEFGQPSLSARTVSGTTH